MGRVIAPLPHRLPAVGTSLHDLSRQGLEGQGLRPLVELASPSSPYPRPPTRPTHIHVSFSPPSHPIPPAEMEVNPNGAAFIAIIHNPSGVKPNSTQLIPCDRAQAAGVAYSAKITEEGWTAVVDLPLAFLDQVRGPIIGQMWERSFWNRVLEAVCLRGSAATEDG
jgi:hypothetical protein